LIGAEGVEQKAHNDARRAELSRVLIGFRVDLFEEPYIGRA